jgi:hypothetical protein
VHDLGLEPMPAVGVMPLGTGNDLSLSFGWGNAFLSKWIWSKYVSECDAYPAVLLYASASFGALLRDQLGAVVALPIATSLCQNNTKCRCPVLSAPAGQCCAFKRLPRQVLKKGGKRSPWNECPSLPPCPAAVQHPQEAG